MRDIKRVRCPFRNFQVFAIQLVFQAKVSLLVQSSQKNHRSSINLRKHNERPHSLYITTVAVVAEQSPKD